MNPLSRTAYSSFPRRSTVVPGTPMTQATIKATIPPRHAASQAAPLDPRKPEAGIRHLMNLEAASLPALSFLTKAVARINHTIFGSRFPEIKDGFITGSQITGTNGADRIEVRYDAATRGAYVTFNGETSFLNERQAQFLSISGGDGDDVIHVDPSFPYPVNISGGNGNDFISGGARNDVLDGGAGNDVIWGNRGHDRVYGGGGDDRIYPGLDQDHPVVR